MTIHTFEVSCMLNNEKYYNIQEELRKKDPCKWKAVKTGMQYWGLSDKGILINMYQVKKYGFYTYYIIYRISARRVIENDNFVGLFNTKKYPELEETANNLLKEKCSKLPKLKECNLKRIDFCVNAHLDNQDQVKAYIKTTKKANVPSKLDIYEQYDKISKRKKPTKDDFTVFSSEYVAISIYNKYMEMKKQKEGVFPQSELERAKGIVRIEIRCMEGKVNALKKKYKIKSISEFMAYGNKIGKELYKYYLKKIFNDGTIWTLKEALQRINNSEYKSENIKLLKEFITECNESRSVAKTYKLYKSIYGKTEVKRIIFMLETIDTSFVTVPNSDAKLFCNGYIPTPYELFKDSVK